MRIVMHTQHGIADAYTLETSMSGVGFSHFGVRDYQDLGAEFCIALLEYLMKREEQTAHAVAELTNEGNLIKPHMMCDPALQVLNRPSTIRYYFLSNLSIASPGEIPISSRLDKLNMGSAFMAIRNAETCEADGSLSSSKVVKQDKKSAVRTSTNQVW